jgi:hypothetical protein
MREDGRQIQPNKVLKTINGSEKKFLYSAESGKI